MDLFKEGRGKLTAQDIFHFNFIVSITHSYFGKAQGNTLLLILLPLDPTFTSPQLNTMSCQSHTMCHNLLWIMICGAKKGPGYGKTSQPWSQFGLSGQEPVPKLSKLLDDPSCKFSKCLSISPSSNTFGWIWTTTFSVRTKYGKISAPRASFSKQSTHARWSQREKGHLFITHSKDCGKI